MYISFKQNLATQGLIYETFSLTRYVYKNLYTKGTEMDGNKLVYK